jgi:hypothetical protein
MLWRDNARYMLSWFARELNGAQILLADFVQGLMQV